MLPIVLATFVVRLRSDRLAAGELVGEVEHVGAGGQGLVHDAAELIGFAQRAIGADGRRAAGAPSPAVTEQATPEEG
jgi:hypothetical protein